MHKLLKYLIIPMFFIFVGCFENSEQDKEPEIDLSSIDTLIKDESLLLENEDDTLKIELNLEEKAYYKIYFYSDNGEHYNINFSLFTSSNDSLFTGNKKIFKVDSTGKYYAYIYSKGMSNSKVQFSYVLKRFDLLEKELEGKWLLVEQNGTAFGLKSSCQYSATAAEQLLEIHGDSIISYSYYDNSLQRSSQLYPSVFGNIEYKLKDNTLELVVLCSLGRYGLKYERFNNDLNDIVWGRQQYSASNDIIGTWYLESEYFHDFSNDNGVEDELEESHEYENPLKTRLVYAITEDSLFEYYRNGWSYNVNKSMLRDKFWPVHMLKREGEKLIYEESYVDKNDIFFEVERTEYNFKSFQNENFLSDWAATEFPDEFLSLNNTYEDSLSAQDTLWFKFYVNEGNWYSVKESKSFPNTHIDLFVFDVYRKQIKSASYFRAEKSGDYYLALMWDYREPLPTQKEPYSISLDGQ